MAQVDKALCEVARDDGVWEPLVQNTFGDVQSTLPGVRGGFNQYVYVTWCWYRRRIPHRPGYTSLSAISGIVCDPAPLAKPGATGWAEYVFQLAWGRISTV